MAQNDDELFNKALAAALPFHCEDEDSPPRKVITATYFLNQINKLRELEQRPYLDNLPKELLLTFDNQRRAWIKRIKDDIRIHTSYPLPYPNLILNTTEIKLITFNRHYLDDNVPPVKYIDPYLAEPDEHYIPEYNERTVFVTDSDCRLIGTPTYTQAGNCYRAAHALYTTFDKLGAPLEFNYTLSPLS